MSRIAVFILFMILWEWASTTKTINPFFFSSPSRIVKCSIASLHSINLLWHIGISLYETILSFVFIMLLSLIIASLLWHFSLLARILEPVFVTLNSLPKSALAPLFIVWLGTGYKTIIIAGISVALFGCIINLYSSFLHTDKAKQTLIKTMGGNQLDVFWYVILPANSKAIFSNMKVNIGLALVGVMIGEFLAARKGLGYLIIYSSQVFQLDLLITCILILCVIAFLLYECISILEQRIFSK